MALDIDKDELACTYAALLMHDENIPITAEKINTVLKAANVKVQPFWPALFGKVLANRNLDDIILSAGGGGVAAPAAPAAPEASSSAPADKGKGPKGGKGKEKPAEVEEKKPADEEKKEEVEEGVDLGGFGLFD